MSVRQPRSASEHTGRYGESSVDDPVAPCGRPVRSAPSIETLRVELSTEEDLMIPEADFRISFTNGETRSGQLDDSGTCVLEGVPPNTPFEIIYSNPADIRAKALAVRLDAGLNAGSYQMVVGVLRESATELAAAKQHYEYYFQPSMVDACIAAFSDEDGGYEVRFLLVQAGLFHGATVHNYNDGR